VWKHNWTVVERCFQLCCFLPPTGWIYRHQRDSWVTSCFYRKIFPIVLLSPSNWMHLQTSKTAQLLVAFTEICFQLYCFLPPTGCIYRHQRHSPVTSCFYRKMFPIVLLSLSNWMNLQTSETAQLLVVFTERCFQVCCFLPPIGWIYRHQRHSPVTSCFYRKMFPVVLLSPSNWMNLQTSETQPSYWLLLQKDVSSCVAFSLQLDESADIRDTAQLLVAFTGRCFQLCCFLPPTGWICRYQRQPSY
jgi:hypothetical protein